MFQECTVGGITRTDRIQARFKIINHPMLLFSCKFCKEDTGSQLLPIKLRIQSENECEPPGGGGCPLKRSLAPAPAPIFFLTHEAEWDRKAQSATDTCPRHAALAEPPWLGSPRHQYCIHHPRPALPASRRKSSNTHHTLHQAPPQAAD
jgi:hypothetical protein